MLLLLWLYLLAFAGADYFCPILGPVFPKPTRFDSKTFKNAFAQFEDTLTNAIENGTSASPYGALSKKTAYSVQFFSTNEETLLYEYHYTPDVVRTGLVGVTKVDGDSMYRVASVSKLFTVYALLISIGDDRWDRPVTEFVPELRALDERSNSDGFHREQWKDITLGALAGQLAGVARDVVVDPSTIQTFYQQAPALNFPPLKPAEYPQCVYNTTRSCNREEFFHAVGQSRPVYAPNTTPVYSNTAFSILAFALEDITGKPFVDLLQETVLGPLSLGGASYSKPADNRGVIPGALGQSWWYADLGVTGPAGGIYSSPNSLSALGRSILNPTLLSPNTTRAWMKPGSHTSSLHASVGRPWEIFRQQLPGMRNRIVDIYSKAGALTPYQSTIGLLPDYGIGWVAFGAGESPSDGPINAMVAELMLPAFEDAARDQAHEALAGTYKADDGLNSSITLTTSPDKPGLGIESWIANGTDVLDAEAASEGADVASLTFRLYPTSLELLDGDDRELSFRVVEDAKSSVMSSNAFSACSTWVSLDPVTWGHHYAIDEMTVVFDEEGVSAEAVIIQAFKTKLMKVTS